MTDKYIIELLPWYINNSLDEDENRMVAEALEKDAQLRKEFEFLKSLASSIKAEEIPTPGEIGLARLKRSMKQSAQTKVTSRPTDNRTGSRWKLIAIAASILVIAQTSFLLNQAPDQQQHYQPLGGENRLPDSIIITFAADVTEQQIREVLLDSQAVIIDGPSAAGLYRIRSNAADINTTIEKLKSYTNVITHIQE